MADRGRPIRGFRDLEVWQKAMNLVVKVYEATKFFPVEERYGLTSQLRRGRFSSVEHCRRGGRFGLRGFLYHLSIATGSIMELETQLFVAMKLGYLKREQARTLLVQLGEVRRLLAGLVRSLRRSTQAVPVPDTR